jgi:hypothetical protein
MVIDDLHLVDGLESGVKGRLLVVTVPLDVELDRGGVEGSTVVELDVVSELQGVSQAVVRDLPISRKTQAGSVRSRRSSGGCHTGGGLLARSARWTL